MTYPHLHLSSECADRHDLIVDFGGRKPTIVVLCGSTRFRVEFEAVNKSETLAGRIVLTVGMFPHHDNGAAPEDVLGVAVKADLDELHKRKIDLADEVFILNVGGYVGPSTRSELEYAQKLGKLVRYLEPIAEGL